MNYPRWFFFAPRHPFITILLVISAYHVARYSFWLGVVAFFVAYAVGDWAGRKWG